MKLKCLVSQENILRVQNSYKLRDMVEVNSAMSVPLDLIDGSMQLDSNGMESSSVDMVNQDSI